jgi:hypothetical protein
VPSLRSANTFAASFGNLIVLQLSYRSTYQLRSNDYYSSRNYASRLIGSKLIFYTPEYLNFGPDGDPLRWHVGR